MPRPSVSAAYVKDVLVNRCGYAQDLVQNDYRFAQGKSVELAAFAHRPFDARSACIAVVDCQTNQPKAEVMKHRELGAPVIFTRFQDRLQVWKPGRGGAKRVSQEMTASELPRFFSEQHDQLAPRRIYDAKTLGRLPDSVYQGDLFVDAGLLPYAESELGRTLTDAVVEVVNILKSAFDVEEMSDQQETWIVKSTFCLLAGKVLQDKRVPNFISLDLLNIDNTFRRVQSHYGSNTTYDVGGSKQQQNLRAAADVFVNLGDTSHLTSETWADVYEQALITSKVRKAFGVHATPSYLVDYMVWQMSPWIEKLKVSELRTFEAGCGHAPFLVSVMRMLRSFDLGMGSEELSSFFRKNMTGIEIDPFSVEIARLSLTLADVPNRNGWAGVRQGDMFAGKTLEEAARRSFVFFSNPPFEGIKPLQLLQRTLPNLPAGAVFGVIVPSTLLFSAKKGPTAFREWMIRHCHLAEISLFPDNIFEFADHECAILLGRKLNGSRTSPLPVRCKRVRESGRADFRMDYRFTTNRTFPQTRVASQPKHGLWVPEWDDEIWSWLSENAWLGSIAEIGQGLTPRTKKELPRGATTVEPNPFPGSVDGYSSSEGNWHIHEAPCIAYFNLDPKAIARPRSGARIGAPQVILNYNPVRRELWRLKPFIDNDGRAVTSNFITVRPKSHGFPLEYIWAIFCSPLANAFFYAHCLKRHHHIGDVRRLPIPKAGAMEIMRVVDRARAYLTGAQAGISGLGFEGTVSEAELHQRLMIMDAEVLRLYQLPARSERKLLKLFEGEQRPGVPITFSSYYPKGFKECVPLYVYLSDTFQARLRGGSANLTAEQEMLYEMLAEKQLEEKLTEKDEAILYALQAEIDGRDYATKLVDDSWIDRLDGEEKQTQKEIGEIAARLSEFRLKGKPRHDRKPRS
jgi:hypothetical protein